MREQNAITFNCSVMQYLTSGNLTGALSASVSTHFQLKNSFYKLQLRNMHIHMMSYQVHEFSYITFYFVN